MANGIDAQVIYNELKFIKENMVSKEDFNSILETFEILHNQETMRQINESSKNVAEGKTKKVRSVKEILD